MTQMRFLFNQESEWPELYILLSLAPRYYHASVIAQTKMYEYRRGQFIDQPVTAFVYATLSKDRNDRGLPNAEIGAVIKLGSPTIGLEEVIQVKEEEEPGSREIMVEWLQGFSIASAHPIEKVHCFAKPVSLKELKHNFRRFQPPQRYIILNNNPELLEFLKQKAELGFGLGIAGEHQLAAVGGRQMDVDHLHGGKLLQHAARRQSRRQRMQAPRERDVQGIGQKGNEDVRLDSGLELVKDRPDREVAFEVLERLLDGHQQQVVAPQLGRIILDEVGA